MSQWQEITAPEGPKITSRAAWVARVAVPLAIAAVFVAIGRPVAAVVVVVLAGGLTVASAVSPRVERTVAVVVAAVGKGVAWLFTTVLLGAVDLLVFAPLSLVAKLTHRDPLTARRDGWRRRPTGAAELSTRTFGPDEAATRPRGPVARVVTVGVRVIGLVLLLLAVNYGLGWVWDEYVGSHEPPTAEGPAPGSPEALAATPATQAAWSDEYWDEFADLDYEFLPYLLSRVDDVDGEHITSTDGVRRSYQAEDAAGEGDEPEVWFFGGGALWGEGQRDLHTIPSEVARLAEEGGTPVRVVNFGQPGYTSWQSAMLLEQELAVRPAPDLVVFYDGADDVAVQLDEPSTAPTHYNADGTTDVLTGRDSARDQLGELWDDYAERSVLHRVLTNLGVIGTQPAGADTPGLTDRVADLHARSVDLAGYVAEREGVPTIFAWQAADGVAGDRGAYREVADQGTGENLAGALDGEDAVYLDGVLTNERGAALVAADLWPLLQPHLR